MIELNCACGQKETADENQTGQTLVCSGCGQKKHLICAETLEAGAGMGDFDASLAVLDGPQYQGERFMLGGVANISIGKQAKEILLPGVRVSRQHCILRRKDFGPSRWEIVDNNSTNGVLVNGERVTETELNHGDEVQIGEYTLRFEVDAAAIPEAAPALAHSAGGTALPPPPPPAPPMPNRIPPGPKRLQPEPKKSNDGWSSDETSFNKMGWYVIMVPGIIGAMLASGFAGADVPIQTLLVIVGLFGVAGGIVNIWGRGPIWAGAIIGAVMALGGLGVAAWWIHGRDRVMWIEMIIAFIVGAVPGFGVQWVLQKAVGGRGE